MEEDSTTAKFLSNSGYEKKRKRRKKSSATDACRKEEPLQHTPTIIPFFPSTNAATIESIVNDCGPSAGIANVMSYVYDEACRGQDHLMGALKWATHKTISLHQFLLLGDMHVNNGYGHKSSYPPPKSLPYTAIS